MYKFTLLLCLTGVIQALAAQDGGARLSVSVSTDSVLMDNVFSATFCLENGEGTDFAPPAFEDFTVAGGPSFSSNMSIIGGQVSRRTCYTYYLSPRTEGVFYIGPASIRIDEQVLESEPVEILVVPNPEGIRQPVQPRDFNPWQRADDLWQDLFRDFRLLLPEPEPSKPAPAPDPKKRRTTRT